MSDSLDISDASLPLHPGLAATRDHVARSAMTLAEAVDWIQSPSPLVAAEAVRNLPADALSEAVVDLVWRQPALRGALLLNPHVDARVASLLIDHATHTIERGFESHPQTGEEPDHSGAWAVLDQLAARGFAASPMQVEALLALLEEREARSVDAEWLENLQSLLLRLPSPAVDENALLRLWEYGIQHLPTTASLLWHPAAGSRLWARVAADCVREGEEWRRSTLETSVLTALSAHQAAVHEPAVYQVLLRCTAPSILYALALNGPESDFRRHVQLLSVSAQGLAQLAAVLGQASPERLARLQRHDLAPLLACGDAELRLRALSVLSHVRDDGIVAESPEAEARRGAGRER
jgi:hypothetical protein